MGGVVVDVPYTPGISSTALNHALREIGITPELRLQRLRRLLHAKQLITVIEVHNGLSALVAEHASVEQDSRCREFDALWISSLTQSAARGRPDNGYLDAASRIGALSDILTVTTKPIIYDGDNGGPPEHFAATVRELERNGISAIIIEDKIGPKKNSLFGQEASQCQDSIDNFCAKLAAGKASQLTEDFMIIARIESLVLGHGQAEALHRAQAYLEAGADGIMIHSCCDNATEIRDFARNYQRLATRRTLVAVPTTYDSIREEELAEMGFNVVIYANHLLRAAYPAMLQSASAILSHHRGREASEHCCMPIRDLITLI